MKGKTNGWEGVAVNNFGAGTLVHCSAAVPAFRCNLFFVASEKDFHCNRGWVERWSVDLAFRAEIQIIY